MKASISLVISLCAFQTVFALKPQQSTCLKSLKGKLCLKLSLKNFGFCVSQRLPVFDAKTEFCAVGTNVCTSKPRVCSGYSHLSNVRNVKAVKAQSIIVRS